MSIFANIVYSVKAIFVLSFGWLLSDKETYDRYITAYKMVRDNPQLAKKIISCDEKSAR